MTSNQETVIVDMIEAQRFPRSEEVACPLCGEKKHSRKIEVKFGMIAMVAECPTCRLVFQTPRPSPEASRAYMNWRWRSSDPYVADKRIQMDRAMRQLSFVKTLIEKPSKLLDFGAGAGSFVRTALDNGWTAIGVELSDSARLRAKQVYDVELMESVPHDTYDVVTMWDVIEHLREPVSVLRVIRDHLTPGGVVFLETANYENWTRLAARDQWGLYLFDHQFYFSPYSLQRMLTEARYAEFRVLDVNHTYPSISFSQNPLAFASDWIEWVLAKMRWGMHGDINVMIGVARKPIKQHYTC